MEVVLGKGPTAEVPAGKLLSARPWSEEWMSARPQGGADKTPGKAAKAMASKAAREPPQVLFVESAAADASDADEAADEHTYGMGSPERDPAAEAEQRAAATIPSNLGMHPPMKSALRRGDIRGVTGGVKAVSPAREVGTDG